MSNAMNERYKGTASQFLQTAVVIDDEPCYIDVEAIRAATTPSRGATTGASASAAPATVAGANKGKRNGNRLDAKRLVDGFASRGIVCSIIQANLPPSGDEGEVDGAEDDGEQPVTDTIGGVVTRAVRAAASADIVVLDWNLTGSETGEGRAALKIISSLVEHDREPSAEVGDIFDGEKGLRTRLIAIYTGEPDLVEKIAQVKTLLQSSCLTEVPSSRTPNIA